ncbi:MAG: DUF3368 domain-containing protein [Acidobacteriota bacterium]
MPEALVVNTSPLVFLGNVGRLSLLREIGTARVIVPSAVFDEVAMAGHVDLAARSLDEADWIEKAAAVAIPASISEWDLGPGESAVIATSLLIPDSRPVIDDLGGRKCALASGLDVMGTLGVVIAAHRRGRVDDPRALLLEMRSRGMWLADAVIERALELARVTS